MSNKVSKSGKKSSSVDSVALFSGIISKAVGVYLVVMFTVFPLFATDMYYDILNDKYYVFFYSTIALFAAFLIVTLIGVMGGALRGEGGKRFFRGFTRFSKTDIFFLAFFVCVILSTVTSEWVYESFWGNMGRLQGMFFFLICFVSYMIVTRFVEFKPYYLYLFLLAGTFLCFWGVTDYLGVDLFGWRADANDYVGMLIFTSSIGNVNTATAVFALYAGAAAVMSIKHKYPWFFIVSELVCLMALVTGMSDNAVLAVAGLYGILPFWCFSEKRGVVRYAILVSVLFLALGLTGTLTMHWTRTPVMPEWGWNSGVFLSIANHYAKYCYLAAGIFAVLSAGLFAAFRTKLGTPARGLWIAWAVIFAAVVLTVVFAFIDVNRGGHAELWGPAGTYLLFNDRWGTNRGYAWRSAFEFFRDFGFGKKLFGTGPETYAIFMAQYNYYDMIDFMDAVFDSPHSEPIQMIFTTGVAGAVCYYGAMITGIVRGIRKNEWTAAFAFAMIAYLFASLINISVPISTPLLIVALELCAAVSSQDDKKE